MQIISSAFNDNEPIPTKYTASGKNISPPLQWTGVPAGTKSLVLTCEDPDAADKPGRDYPITHWVAYNILPHFVSLSEHLENKKSIYVPQRVDQGKNTLGKIGYSGPKPPAGDQPHRYIFTIYALDIEKVAEPGAEHAAVHLGMQGHLLETARTIGTYIHGQPPIKKSKIWHQSAEL
jgi:Raf kinase inhibitor-like YbhB/YbcL family protein